MRITFVNTRRQIYPNLGMCYLSAYVKERIPEIKFAFVDIGELEPQKHACERILAAHPDIVAITTYTVRYDNIISLIKMLKRSNPDLPVWLGGPHITSLPRTLPLEADIGVLGEGEESFYELCLKASLGESFLKESLPDLKGVCYRGTEGEIVINEPRAYIQNLDSIPMPDLSLLDMGWYTKDKRFFVMEKDLRGFVLLSSRGCPYNCCFCQASMQWGKIRYHSSARVIAEIERLRRDYPHLNAINIIDDLFIADRNRLIEIAGLIRKKNLHKGIFFNVNARANLVDKELIELLKSINVIQISYGFESGSDRILSFLKRKTVSLEDNERAACLTNLGGIGVGGQFMAGTPGETEEDIEKTLAFIKSHRMSHAHLSVTSPLPGTGLWDMAKTRGLVSDNMDWSKFDFDNTDNAGIVYLNEDVIPRERFNALLSRLRKACDIWNPAPKFTDYLCYMRAMPVKILIKKTIRKIFSGIKCSFLGVRFI